MKHVQVYLRELIGMLLAATKTLNVLLQMDEGTTEKELTSMFNMIEKNGVRSMGGRNKYTPNRAQKELCNTKQSTCLLIFSSRPEHGQS